MSTVENIDRLAKEIWYVRGKPLNADLENWTLAEYFQKTMEDKDSTIEKTMLSKRYSDKMVLAIKTRIPRIILRLILGADYLRLLDQRVEQIRLEWIEEDSWKTTTTMGVSPDCH